jgi:hypothetical protein
VRDLLDNVRREERRLRSQGGRLGPRDYAYLDDQLDGVSRQIQGPAPTTTAATTGGGRG